MTTQRKYIKNDLMSLNRIIYLFNYKKNTSIKNLREKDFNNAINYLDKTITELKDKKQKLSIRNKYSGDFYLKRPYKVTGGRITFIRKDFVSSIIKSEDEYDKNLYSKRIHLY